MCINTKIVKGFMFHNIFKTDLEFYSFRKETEVRNKFAKISESGLTFKAIKQKVEDFFFGP